MDYREDEKITAEQFVDVLRRSTLAERRPVDELDRIQAMIDHADLLVTAWDEDLLVGVARSVTDYSYCCYLSDLAVDREYQSKGIGRELLRRTMNLLHPQCTLILLAAPRAQGYYPHIGFRQHQSAWILLSNEQLK
ncbi:MAG: GNAT family N-acetyltransferase [Anaerolineales bacterium]|jgi:GNAT superfamily N-acetyltransferase